MPDDYQRIAKAINYLQKHARTQPSLDDLAEHIGLSPYHFQRLFRRFAGVSPKRFLQHLTTQYAKKLLRQSTSVLETSYAIGQNPIGYLIPCHRVLRTDGGLGGYRWGVERKLAILGCELKNHE